MADITPNLVDDNPLKDTTFLVGAGASRAWPAGLPLFGPIREHLINRLRVRSRLRDAARRLEPEAFMRVVHEGGLPLEDWLTDLLSQGDPNAVHFVLASAIQSDATVWTVNVDDHIERACESQEINLVVSADSELPPHPSARLLKPHGSVRDRRYIFRSDQVVRPLPGRWAERLRADTIDRHLVVVGYRGADVDLRFHLGQAIRDAASVTWFTTPAQWEKLTERFDGLRGAHCTPQLTDHPDDLTGTFLSWADAHGLTGYVSTALRAAARDKREPAVPRFVGRTRTAQGLLYAGLGARKQAKFSFLLALLTCERPFTFALQTLITLSAYTRSWWTRLILWITAQPPVAHRLPPRARRRLDRVHITILSSYKGDYDAALSRLDVALDKDDLAIRLAVAKAQRTLGQLQEAEETALGCLHDATEQLQVDDAAHASFELAFTRTWQGRLSNAKAVLTDFFDGRDAQASIRWIGWACFQQASILIYENNADAANRLFDKGIECFRSDRLDSGIVACTLGKMTACRLADAGDAFLECQKIVESYQPKRRWRRTEGWTSFTTNALLLEVAEYERCHESSTDRARYEAVLADPSVRPLHEAMALLGLAEIDIAEGRDSDNARRCGVVAERAGLRYVQAHLVITDWRAGRLTSDEAMQRIAASEAELTSRTGDTPERVTDYCLGQHPEHHELFLP